MPNPFFQSAVAAGLLLAPAAMAAPEIYWEDGGASILVEDLPEELACGVQRFLVAEGRFEPEPPGLRSPGGAFRLTRQEGAVGLKAGDAPERSVPLPVLLDPEEVKKAALRWVVPDQVQARGAWLPDDSWLYCQWLAYTDLGACAILNPETGRFGQALQVPLPDCSGAYRIEPGPGGWLVIYRALEGHLVAELLHFDAGQGARPSGLVMPSLYDFGPLEVHFSAGGDRVWLVTPCALAENPELHACMGIGGVFLDELQAPWRLYEWTPERPQLSLVRADLPRWAAPHPSDGSFAWATDDLLCLGDPAQPHQVRCHYLPTSLAEGERCPGDPEPSPAMAP